MLSGEARWRRDAIGEAVVGLRSGLSLSIPLGTDFQFRCLGANPARVAVTLPPWPGASEALPVTPLDAKRSLSRLLRPAPLAFAGHAVVVAVHLDAGAVLQEPGGFARTSVICEQWVRPSQR